nr:4'-phosphopantetheinyl transferase superfamily protein [uncultured Kingella sp.]
MTKLICLLGTRKIAHEYNRALLSPEDACRVAQSPQLESRLDWQVSRALKQRASLPVVSLSHSASNAAVLCADQPIGAGVDVEMMRPRDFAALSAWVCSDDEREYLRQHNWQPEKFYRLWCSKEALIKAAGLDFPADMRRVSCNGADGGWRVDGQTGWFGITRTVGSGLMLACAWRQQNVTVEILEMG